VLFPLPTSTTMFSLAHAMKSSSSSTDRCIALQGPQVSPWNVATITHDRSFASAHASA
jgi:hypothetical protein